MGFHLPDEIVIHVGVLLCGEDAAGQLTVHGVAACYAVALFHLLVGEVEEQQSGTQHPYHTHGGTSLQLFLLGHQFLKQYIHHEGQGEETRLLAIERRFGIASHRHHEWQEQADHHEMGERRVYATDEEHPHATYQT